MTTIVVTTDGLWLEEHAGRQLRALAAAAAREGLSLYLASAGRTPAQQAVLRAKFLRGEGPPAAPPGHSRHERGMAVDFKLNPKVRAWLRRNAPLYGWYPTGESFSDPEPWHYEFNP